MEAEVEVLAKGALLDHRPQVPMGWPTRDGNRRRSPRILLRGRCALLQHAQQRRLRRERQFPHLVEEQRPRRRLLEASLTLGVRARERPTLVPEKLALQQRGRDGCAVESDERSGSATGQIVQLAGAQLLARPGFTQEQDRGVESSDSPQLAEEQGERRFRRMENLLHRSCNLEHRRTDFFLYVSAPGDRSFPGRRCRLTWSSEKMGRQDMGVPLICESMAYRRASASSKSCAISPWRSQTASFVTLLGPSGCGKTTLLRILAGFEIADKGTATLGDRDLFALPPHQRPVNTVFQNYALFPHLTGRAERRIRPRIPPDLEGRDPATRRHHPRDDPHRRSR